MHVNTGETTISFQIPEAKGRKVQFLLPRGISNYYRP